MKKVVIIHGNGGCTNQMGWYPWLKAELEKQNIKVLAPTMPDNIEAKASIWLPYMRDVLQCDQETIIVGHSSGAVAAMRYAEQYQLLGSVLIGACYTDLGFPSEKLSGYYNAPWQWEKIKANQQFISLFASTDDPYIPVKEAHYIQEHLACDYHEYKNQGHFVGITIPDICELIIEKLKYL